MTLFGLVVQKDQALSGDANLFTRMEKVFCVGALVSEFFYGGG